MSIFVCKKCTWPVIKCNMIRSLSTLLPHKKQLHSPLSLQSAETEAECTGLSCLLDCISLFYGATHTNTYSAAFALQAENKACIIHPAQDETERRVTLLGRKCTCVCRGPGNIMCVSGASTVFPGCSLQLIGIEYHFEETHKFIYMF